MRTRGWIEEKENMKRELSMEKEKLHTLEQAMQEYGNLQGALLLVSLIVKGIDQSQSIVLVHSE